MQCCIRSYLLNAYNLPSPNETNKVSPEAANPTLAALKPRKHLRAGGIVQTGQRKNQILLAARNQPPARSLA